MSNINPSNSTPLDNIIAYAWESLDNPDWHNDLRQDIKSYILKDIIGSDEPRNVPWEREADVRNAYRHEQRAKLGVDKWNTN